MKKVHVLKDWLGNGSKKVNIAEIPSVIEQAISKFAVSTEKYSYIIGTSTTDNIHVQVAYNAELHEAFIDVRLLRGGTSYAVAYQVYNYNAKTNRIDHNGWITNEHMNRLLLINKMIHGIEK